jgi:His-Xaa-Ser repeat protein HxsA
VSTSAAQSPDPNVTAVQTDLTKLGYYKGVIDGLFGRDTRDALAHYQTDHNLAVTGTLTTETLQTLGVQRVASN